MLLEAALSGKLQPPVPCIQERKRMRTKKDEEPQHASSGAVKESSGIQQCAERDGAYCSSQGVLWEDGKQRNGALASARKLNETVTDASIGGGMTAKTPTRLDADVVLCDAQSDIQSSFEQEMKPSPPPKKKMRRAIKMKVPAMKRSLRSQEANNDDANWQHAAFRPIPHAHLTKLGFRFFRNKILLPEHCGDPDKIWFENEESLRRHLCKEGIPLPPDVTSVDEVLGEREKAELREWVRYYIVANILEPNIVYPPIGKTSDAIDIVSESLGITYGGGQTWQDLERTICQMGLPEVKLKMALESDVETRIKITQVLLYVAESTNVNTFYKPEVSERAKRPEAPKKQPLPPEKPKPHSTNKCNATLKREDPPQKILYRDGYSRRKSLLKPSAVIERKDLRAPESRGDVPFWETLGSVNCPHHCNFEWDDSSFIGWRSGLGRAYYGSFRLNGITWQVGDFLWIKEGEQHEELHRIVSAFQALKSFIGNWENPDDELQKRGQVYIEVTQLVVVDEDDGCGLAVALPVADDWHPGCVDARPLRLFDSELSLLRKSTVHVLKGASLHFGQAEVVCSQAVNRGKVSSLTELQYSLLTSSADILAEKHAANRWPDSGHASKLRAKQVQIMRTERPRSSKASTSEPPVHTTIDSDYQSDDSDSFDSDSQPSGFDFDEAWEKKFKSTMCEFRKQMQENDLSKPLPRLVYSGSPRDPRTSHKGQECQTDVLVEQLATYCEVASNPSALAEALLHQLKDLKEHFSIIVEGSHPLETEDDRCKKDMAAAEDQHLKRLGHGSFRGLQLEVCCEAIDSYSDIVFIAPCGLGKTLCFLVPSLEEKGITIVVEPLNSTVKSQLGKLKRHRRILDAERLLTVEDAKAEGALSASDRLTEILNQNRPDQNAPKKLSQKPHIIFTTPELLSYNLDRVKKMSECGILRRIVMDEFDSVSSCHEHFRPEYPKLLPKLREECKGSATKFMFLSATTNDATLRGLLSNQSQPKPKLFLSSRAVSDSLCFRVERKQDLPQVAKRIYNIVQNWMEQNDSKKKPKCICYCAQKATCVEMKKLLSNVGLQAEVATSEQHADMERFKNGKIQVLCATTALGRGVDVSDIRFIFHALLPLSLTNYIQETGRAGRDGVTSYAYMFYRPQDHTVCANIRTERKRNNRSIDTFISNAIKEDNTMIMKYCTQANECRYKQLAEHVVLPLGASVSQMQKCPEHAKCDICHQSNPCQQVDISVVVKELLVIVQKSARREWEKQKLDLLMQHVIRRAIVDDNCILTLEQLTPLLIDTDFDKSLRSDLARLLTWIDALESPNWRTYRRADNLDCILHQLHGNEIRFFLQATAETTSLFQSTAISTSKPGAQAIETSKNMAKIEGPSKVLEVDHASRDCAHTTYEELLGIPNSTLLHHWPAQLPLESLPFLIQFEMLRIISKKEQRDTLETNGKTRRRLNDLLLQRWHELSRHEACKSLHEAFGITKEMSRYEGVTVASSPNESVGSSLFFHATMRESPPYLVLHQPEDAADRRVFRKYGSHRFLFLNVANSISREKVELLLHDGFSLAGRKWAFLWCKATKSPQSFILFAERGVGIDDISAEEVRQWCFSTLLNPDDTIQKQDKRMKLSFSKTTPSGKLRPHCFERIPDIVNSDAKGGKGNVMTDGCGLISAEALEFVWESWRDSCTSQSKTYNSVEDESQPCPFTSFQARIGSMKGMFVLDPSLDGFCLQFRDSQHKFKSPMRSLKDGHLDPQSKFDDAFDTIEICSWDGKLAKGYLSVRLIQLLEDRGVGVETFLKFVDDGLKWLGDFKTDHKTLIRYLEMRHSAIVSQGHAGEGYDTELLVRMIRAKCSKDEPVFLQKLNRLIRREANFMRQKARYPVGQCYHMRLIPDHTGLLQEGEAFVAMDQGSISSIQTSHVLTVRFPSYFAGDMRKLKLVDSSMLANRSPRPKCPCKEPHEFFRRLRNCLVLSTNGLRAEADSMSGGDYDGDKAWVCWNPLLVDSVNELEPHVTNSSEFRIRKSHPGEREQMRNSDAQVRDRVDFALHYRKHQGQLGKLSILLDRVIDIHGLRSNEARAVGTQAFLQVDHPYYLCQIPGPQEPDSVKKPHWAATDSNDFDYRSDRALGKIWDYAEDKIEEIVKTSSDDQPNQPNQHILDEINQARKADPELVYRLQEQMKGAIKAFITERKELMGRQTPTSCKEVERKNRIVEWTEYCRKQRSELIDNHNGGFYGGPKQRLAAAILYRETWNRDVGLCPNEHMQIMSFCWAVAEEQLIRIVGDAESKKRNGRLAETIVESID